MGSITTWLSSPKQIKEFITDLYTVESDTFTTRVLDIAIKKFTVAYLAVEVSYKGGPTYVYAGVCLYHYQPNGDYNFWYKTMDETVGPNEADCPERILKLLTPLEANPELGELSLKWSKEWRNSCWSTINKRKAASKAKAKRKRQLKRLKKGSVVKLHDHTLTICEGYTPGALYGSNEEFTKPIYLEVYKEHLEIISI